MARVASQSECPFFPKMQETPFADGQLNTSDDAGTRKSNSSSGSAIKYRGNNVLTCSSDPPSTRAGGQDDVS